MKVTKIAVFENNEELVADIKDRISVAEIISIYSSYVTPLSNRFVPLISIILFATVFISSWSCEVKSIQPLKFFIPLLRAVID